MRHVMMFLSIFIVLAISSPIWAEPNPGQWPPPAQPSTVIVKPDGTQIVVGPHQQVQVIDRTNDSRTGQVTNHNETANAQGSNVDANGQTIDQKLVTSPPEVKQGEFKGATSSSGSSQALGSDTNTTFKLTGLSPSQVIGCLAGIAVIVAGGVIGYFFGWKLGAVVALSGVVVFILGVMAEKNPDLLSLAGLIVLLVLGGAVGWVVYSQHKEVKQQATKAEDNQWGMDKLVSVVNTFTKTYPDQAEALLDVVKHESNDEYQRDFKDMVTDSKARQGIKSEDPFIKAQRRARVSSQAGTLRTVGHVTLDQTTTASAPATPPPAPHA